MNKYDDHRTFLSGISDNMSRSIAELEARVDELKSQKKFLDDAVQALNVYEHVSASKE